MLDRHPGGRWGLKGAGQTVCACTPMDPDQKRTKPEVAGAEARSCPLHGWPHGQTRRCGSPHLTNPLRSLRYTTSFPLSMYRHSCTPPGHSTTLRPFSNSRPNTARVTGRHPSHHLRRRGGQALGAGTSAAMLRALGMRQGGVVPRLCAIHAPKRTRSSASLVQRSRRWR